MAIKTTWKRFRERYEAEIEQTCAEATIKKYRISLNSYQNLMKPGTVTAIRSPSIADWVSKLRVPERTETTLAGYCRHLKAPLNWAYERNMIDAVPRFPKFRRAKTHTAKGRPISREEFQKYRDAAPNYYQKFILDGLWTSGLRLGEAIKLHWTDRSEFWVDSDGQFPLFGVAADHEKGRQDRIFPIAPDFWELIKDRPREGYVFPFSHRTVMQASFEYSQIGKDSGVILGDTGKHPTIHDLRRSFGARWSRKVMPAVLMNLMRHESIETTMKYYVVHQAQANAELLWKIHENGD